MAYGLRVRAIYARMCVCVLYVFMGEALQEKIMDDHDPQRAYS